MLRSMFSGVTGLRAHQVMMDVTANNLANVNTTGYKSSRATFQDHLYQTLRGSTAGSSATPSGGIDPMQLGLGVSVAGFEGNFSQGAMMLTNRALDVAIQGEGMFAVQDASGADFYTRAGSFSWDNAGNLVTSTGHIVVGWNGSDPPDGTAPVTTGGAGPINVDPTELQGIRDISVGGDGVIAGRDDTGAVVYLGTIGMATFANLNGLDRVGETMFGATPASGVADIGVARTGARGVMTGGTLEMSNVDVAQEFTQLIMAQRGFQANARTITTSDEMLSELVNIKR